MTREIEKFLFQIVARDGGGLYSNPVTITLTVENINDLPTMITREVTVRLPHTTPPQTVIADLTQYVTDPDDGITPLEFYIISDTEYFELELNGTLYTSSELDLTPDLPYLVFVAVFDDQFYSRVSTISVYVFNASNLSPYFNQTKYNFTIVENSAPQAFQVTLTAFDDDSLGYEPAEFPVSGQIASYQFIQAPIADNPFHPLCCRSPWVKRLVSNQTIRF